MQRFSEGLLAQLKAEVEEISKSEQDAFKQLSRILKAIRSALKELKEYVQLHPFEDQARQIHFFKHIKPQFCALRIYYLEKFNVDTSRPVGDAELLKEFYRKELQAVQRFFRHYSFHYQYYRSGATELDALYFVPGVEVESVLIPERPENDPGFSTACDYVFAKIIAFESLQRYLLRELEALAPVPVGSKRSKAKPLVWTGESINLVELGYGLYDTGQLNNGEAGVHDIFSWLEENFQVSIGIPARRFVEIKRRKRLSRSRFMDNMRDAILKRIDEDERYDPEKIREKYRK